MSVSMAVCCVTARPGATPTDTLISFLAFLLLEVGIGMYFPAISYLRRQVIPESHRANVMTWFRVPMNVITCGALPCLHVDWISQDKRIVFAACLLLCIIGTLLSKKFEVTFRESNGSKKPSNDGEVDVKSGLLEEEDV